MLIALLPLYLRYSHEACMAQSVDWVRIWLEVLGTTAVFGCCSHQKGHGK
jgi:hypothetical protein